MLEVVLFCFVLRFTASQMALLFYLSLFIFLPLSLSHYAHSLLDPSIPAPRPYLSILFLFPRETYMPSPPPVSISRTIVDCRLFKPSYTKS